MSGFSTHTDNLIINHIFTGTDFATPPKFWALFKSGAGLTENTPASWEEVTGGGYARVAVENTDFTTSTASSTSNKFNVEFPVAEADWGRVSHIAVMDSGDVNSGNVIGWGLIRNPVTMETQPRDVFAGDQFVIRANTATIRILDSATV